MESTRAMRGEAIVGRAGDARFGGGRAWFVLRTGGVGGRSRRRGWRAVVGGVDSGRAEVGGGGSLQFALNSLYILVNDARFARVRKNRNISHNNIMLI